jgi:hypothetical protein
VANLLACHELALHIEHKIGVIDKKITHGQAANKQLQFIHRLFLEYTSLEVNDANALDDGQRALLKCLVRWILVDVVISISLRVKPHDKCMCRIALQDLVNTNTADG